MTQWLHAPPTTDSNTNTNMQYESKVQEAMALFRERNAEYKDAFKTYGLLGIVYEILGILSRLPVLSVWAPDQGRSQRKKLRDLFLDCINYCVMALIVMEDNNWDGRPESDFVQVSAVQISSEPPLLKEFGAALQSVSNIHAAKATPAERIEVLETVQNEAQAKIYDLKKGHSTNDT